jgi:hypothetical protein
MIKARTGSRAHASTNAGRPASCARTAGQDDTEPPTDLPDLGQRLANLKEAHLAEPPDTLDLERLERREHLFASRVDD